MLGLFSRQVVDPRVSSSAGGFNRAIGQLGGAMAGTGVQHLLASRCVCLRSGLCACARVLARLAGRNAIGTRYSITTTTAHHHHYTHTTHAHTHKPI